MRIKALSAFTCDMPTSGTFWNHALIRNKIASEKPVFKGNK